MKYIIYPWWYGKLKKGKFLKHPIKSMRYKIKTLKKYSKQNRSRPTEAALVLRRYLSQIHIPHASQRVIGNYIVDFFFISRSLIVEVDGGYHQYRKEYDEDREKYLKNIGFKVLRFTNEQILNDTKFCIEQILCEPEILANIKKNKRIIADSKRGWLRKWFGSGL